jgi:hypothetical protein
MVLKLNDIYIKNGLISAPCKPDKEIMIPDKKIYPGFCDSHTHFVQLGIKKKRLNLSKVKSKEELFEKLYHFIKEKEKEEIIIAEDWDESTWKDRAFPTKKEINRISKTKPIILRRVCGHMAVANDSALVRIPDGLQIIDRKTGILEEDVVLKINEIFPPSFEEIKKAILIAQNDLLKLGITAIHDISVPGYFKACQELEKEGKLKLLIYCFIKEDYIDEINTLSSSKKVKLAGIKIFTDGSIGARTAAIKNFSYKDGSKGLILKNEEYLKEIIKNSNKKGYQLAIHAIGDKAIEVVLNAMKVNPEDNPSRHRIEHFELANDSQIKKAVSQNLILSMQPNFIKWSKPGGLYEMVLGKNYTFNNRFSYIINEGGKIAFGSDGMPYGPLFGIKEVTEAPLLSQKINKKDAIKAYTEGGAYASFMEEEMGKIEKGMEADLVALDKDGIYMTVVNGNIEYCRKNYNIISP